MEENNQLFTILQVSERLKVPKPTLRFWEKELNGMVVPLRTHGGQRRYTAQNLLVLEEIKRCRENGLSLSEIVERIQPGGGPPQRFRSTIWPARDLKTLNRARRSPAISSASFRSSSGSISGISSRIGYHLRHLGQTINPSTITAPGVFKIRSSNRDYLFNVYLIRKKDNINFNESLLRLGRFFGFFRGSEFLQNFANLSEFIGLFKNVRVNRVDNARDGFESHLNGIF
jgi:DNA-binding transcriptional MerR regulator